MGSGGDKGRTAQARDSTCKGRRRSELHASERLEQGIARGNTHVRAPGPARGPELPRRGARSPAGPAAPPASLLLCAPFGFFTSTPSLTCLFFLSQASSHLWARFCLPISAPVPPPRWSLGPAASTCLFPPVAAFRAAPRTSLMGFAWRVSQTPF